MEDKRQARLNEQIEEVRRLQQAALDYFDIPLKGIDSTVIKYQIIADIHAELEIRNG
jgi:hypothetical protein